jgi:hypothetical protein
VRAIEAAATNANGGVGALTGNETSSASSEAANAAARKAVATDAVACER